MWSGEATDMTMPTFDGPGCSIHPLHLDGGDGGVTYINKKMLKVIGWLGGLCVYLLYRYVCVSW